MKYFNQILLAIHVLSFGCHTPQNEISIEQNPQLTVDITHSSTPPPTSESNVAGDNFCKDNIPSKFIQAQHQLTHQSKLSNSSPKKRRSLEREAELESYLRFNNHLPTTFGGIPVHASKRIHTWIKYFTENGRQEFLLWLIRSESSKEVIIPILRSNSLPEEFIFLAMIESGFSNQAFSRSAASGTWQFMRPTAKHYGLKVNYWVDERRDPIKSTVAASRYLKDLHRQFGDWFLALAAYNAGPGKIRHAMKATRTRDFWALANSPYLKPETKNYIPKLLAAFIIASNPRYYGFDVIEDVRNTTPLTNFELSHSHSLSDLSGILEVPLQQLRRWNPELIHFVTPPTKNLQNQTYPLRVPAPLVGKLASAKENLPKVAISEMELHRVSKGETLSSIALRYNVSVSQILKDNPTLNLTGLKPGQFVAVASARQLKTVSTN